MAGPPGSTNELSSCFRKGESKGGGEVKLETRSKGYTEKECNCSLRKTANHRRFPQGHLRKTTGNLRVDLVHQRTGRKIEIGENLDVPGEKHLGLQVRTSQSRVATAILYRPGNRK